MAQRVNPNPAREMEGLPHVPISVVILTLNEERNIGPCIESCLGWCDDIYVLDSGSKDHTREIAESLGAKVYYNKFESFGQQRNWAIDNIPCRYAWHFHLDADERFLPAVVREMAENLGPDGKRSTFAAYRCPSKMIFLGRWLKWSGGYPAYQVRLFHKDRCRFRDFGHGQREVPNGPVGTLKHPYLHLNFSHGLVQWFKKHNGYSSREADEAVHVRGKHIKLWEGLFNKDPVERRRTLKNLSYRVKARWLLRFFDMYVRRLGILDGQVGFQYSAMIATYEYWTEIKIKEHESEWYARTTRLARRMGGVLEGDLSQASQKTPGATARSGLGVASAPPPGAPRIDVMIPTLNEIDHIAECIRCAGLLGNAYVLDSFSTDGTQEEARKRGAHVLEHKFVNYALQKNWGLDNLPFTGDWVFILDADERITPELRENIYRMIERHPEVDGYYVNRELLILGEVVRNGGLYPAWNLRLFKRGRARYEERSVHEHMVCQGPTMYMPGVMLHVRRETMAAYLDKHIRYADMESDEWVAVKLGSSTNAPVNKLFRDHLRIRQWLRRRVWPVLPWRPFWRFIYMYFIRLGILDGAAGWHLAMLMATYEYMITLFYRDKLDRARTGDWKFPSAKTEEPKTAPQPATAS
jgi:glycosyltransferase involved in cell wall biosynthesis